MYNIHKILTILRFFQHGTFIVLSFILFDNSNYNKNRIFGFKVYICVSFVIVFGLYYYIVVYKFAIQNKPTSTNRTLKQLLDSNLYNEIVEMVVFGFKYSDKEWHTVMQDFGICNFQIAATLTAFLSRNASSEVDHILSTIKEFINTKDRRIGNLNDRDGNTVLHWALDDRYGSVECVSKLLEHAANPNVKNFRGQTPLHCAVTEVKKQDKLPQINLLLQFGAKVNAKDTHKRTPLHYAAKHQSNHNYMNAMLGVSNVKVNVRDNNGKTALDYAFEAKTGPLQMEENNPILKLIAAGGKLSSELK